MHNIKDYGHCKGGRDIEKGYEQHDTIKRLLALYLQYQPERRLSGGGGPGGGRCGGTKQRNGRRLEFDLNREKQNGVCARR